MAFSDCLNKPLALNKDNKPSGLSTVLLHDNRFFQELDPAIRYYSSRHNAPMHANAMPLHAPTLQPRCGVAAAIRARAADYIFTGSVIVNG
jgi:hypothetical protein